MTVESRVDAFLDRIHGRFGAALEDAAEHAASLPGSPGDLRAVRTGDLVGRIGSSRRYAKAQERGAFIRPKKRRALRFASGRFSAKARLPAQRYLARTVRIWPRLIAARLRELGS